jgi:RecG-like helicase
LQLYQEMVSESELRDVVSSLMDSAAEKESPLELEEPLDLETQFLDSTCVELNIHYPTDWVLLRDAVRMLMKATMLIRKRELKARMNRLSMEMAKQARQILDRMDTILERLPYALKQAHERIIGERQVANEEKILSLYEGHAAVYVRGKAGAEVEFGSQLLLAGRGIVNAIAPRDAGLLRARLRESRALHKAS